MTVIGHRTVHLKSLCARLPGRKLSFADEEMFREMLMLERGDMIPISIPNNSPKNVVAVFDGSLRGQRSGGHPMENAAAIFIVFRISWSWPKTMEILSLFQTGPTRLRFSFIRMKVARLSVLKKLFRSPERRLESSYCLWRLRYSSTVSIAPGKTGLRCPLP